MTQRNLTQFMLLLLDSFSEEDNELSVIIFLAKRYVCKSLELVRLTLCIWILDTKSM